MNKLKEIFSIENIIEFFSEHWAALFVASIFLAFG